MIAVEPMSTNEEFLWVADCPVCKTHHAVRARVAPPRICLSCLRADFPNWEAVERRDTASPPADPAADRDGGGGT